MHGNNWTVGVFHAILSLKTIQKFRIWTENYFIYYKKIQEESILEKYKKFLEKYQITLLPSLNKGKKRQSLDSQKFSQKKERKWDSLERNYKITFPPSNSYDPEKKKKKRRKWKEKKGNEKTGN